MSEELSDEELDEARRDPMVLHLMDHNRVLATIDALTTQLAEMTMERDLERAGRSGSRLRATAYEEMYRDTMDRALTAEATIDRYREALERMRDEFDDDDPCLTCITSIIDAALTGTEPGVGTDVPPPSH